MTTIEGVMAPPRNLFTEKNMASLCTADASSKVGFMSNVVYGAATKKKSLLLIYTH